MKKLSVFTCVILIILSTNLMGQWKILNEGIGRRVIAIDFVNENIGWIAGERTLTKTEDGGETWIAIPLDENIGFDRIDLIDFIDESVGWGIFSYWDSIEERVNSIITKSVDGGQSWTIQKKYEDYEIWEIFVVDDSVVYVLGGKYDSTSERFEGGIWKTSDGGSIWIDISPDLTDKDLSEIWFFSPDSGIIYGSHYDGNAQMGLILKTHDGAETWEEQTTEQFTSLDRVQFVNDSTGCFLATKENEENTEYFLCATTDTCSSWTIKLKSDYPIKDYFCLNKTTVFALVEDSISTYIMKSMDGGDSWEKIEEFFNEVLKIYFNTAKKGLLLGRIDIQRFGYGFNILWQCTDGGNSWKLTDLTYPFLDVFFIDQYIGFVSGGGRSWHDGNFGRLFKTYNSGKSWEFVSEIAGALTEDCLFITKDTGFTLVEEGVGNRILKTIDGGTTWDTVFENNIDSLGFNFFCKQIGFINEEIGYTVGGYNISNVEPGGAGILRTANGGENWDLVWTHHHTDEYNYRLNSVHTVNKTTWAVGNSGIVVKSVSPDSFRVLSVNTDLPLGDVFFSDEHHGWIAGGYFDEFNVKLILLKTTDGGETWNENRDLNYQINDMYFADSLHGWAVGNDTSYNGNWRDRSECGIILETTNAGINWIVQVGGLNGPLNSIHFKDGYGWAVGHNGLLLRTEDGINWIDQNTGKSYPNEYSLSQNYPNPFNPTTAIGYQLSAISNVELNIYNLLGQKIATLVNKKQQAGYYRIEWDASRFASGIYYYRIQADDFTQVRKMVYLK